MVTGRISASRLLNLKAGKYADGGNLWLFAKEGGSASKVKHHAAIEYAELSDFMAALSTLPGSAAEALAH